MPYYTLAIEPGKALCAVASGREAALDILGKELEQNLSLEGEPSSDYLMDEWHESPHWTNPTIPVFVVSN